MHKFSRVMVAALTTIAVCCSASLFLALDPASAAPTVPEVSASSEASANPQDSANSQVSQAAVDPAGTLPPVATPAASENSLTPEAPVSAPAASSAPAATPTGANPTTSATAVAEQQGLPMGSSKGPFTADPAVGAEANPQAKGPATEGLGQAAMRGAPQSAALDAFTTEMLRLINQSRAANMAGPLVFNGKISAGSQAWSRTINARINAGQYDVNTIHRSDAGVSILPGGFDMYSEIIAINGTAAQLVNWWMGSPAHRNAMLDKRATDIGLGYTKTTMNGWGNMTVAVANIAGYPASRVQPPQSPATAVLSLGDVAAVDTDGGLYIYPSAKGGDLWQRNRVSMGWSSVQQTVVSDFNKDGRADVVGLWKDGRLTLSLGQANGTLAAPSQIGIGWAGFEIVIAHWKTTDKYPSIIAKHRATGDLRLYPNTNGRNFAAPTKIGIGWSSFQIFAVDFDLDGKQDLVAKNSRGQLLLYRGTGAGGFMSEPRRAVGSAWNGMTHISNIYNHLGTGANGLLARDSAGNLLHYPMVKNGFRARTLIGSGGWGPLKLGS